MELTSDDLLSGDEAAIRAKVDEYVKEKVKEADTLPAEKQAEVDNVKKEYSVFSDEDAEVREIAETMLHKAIKVLPENAGAAEYKAAAEGVSKKLAKMRVEKQAKEEEQQQQVPGPAPTAGGGAAASHIVSGPPKNVEEAEALADKIASDFTMK